MTNYGIISDRKEMFMEVLIGVFAALFMPIFVVIFFILVSSIKQITEYERGILFRFGKFARILEPGWHFILPIVHTYQKVDIRTKAVDVPEQDAIKKDNVSIRINDVLYYKLFNAAK